MMKKVLRYGAVGLLGAALVGGSAYILLNPAEVRAQQGAASSSAQGRPGAESWEAAPRDGYIGGRGRGGGGGSRRSVSQAMRNAAAVEDLSAEEIAGIVYMREEEKLARDVYLTLYEQWGLPIFQNIAASEQSHMDAVGRLIESYGLEDPAAGMEVGELTDPSLQSLHDELLARGSSSRAQALRVGAAIEEIDILDLEERLAQTLARDIEQVYANLLRGASNHLRSFVVTLERQEGVTYEPAYLDQQQFDEILSGSAERYGGAYGGDRGQSSMRGGAAASERGLDDGQARGRMAGRGALGDSRSHRGSNGSNGTVEWETITGVVVAVEGEVTIETTTGDIVIGMGQAAFWQDFALKIGDEISVTGYHEDGEFKAGSVENRTSGATITLRDTSGRPMWAGRGQRQAR